MAKLVVRKTPQEVIKETGKRLVLCFQGLKKVLNTGLILQPRNDRNNPPQKS